MGPTSSPNRLRHGYGGPPELHAKAEGLRYIAVSTKKLRYIGQRP